ncbi:MltR family transcriptional regulator [Hydrogenophaga sp. SL48]|uniref:MltR family transcriptional regulator n=1 Tax=Hydrogenophaga sp. SL48 TaxID=2806347 RepID=UPI001F27EC5E|nr:MltR family transcriptional regulator [Hydrogenophaga sp. SL48]UJW80100.1 hypothetical protein IM738_19875 [Hydrogenophaga sp. SL48]
MKAMCTSKASKSAAQPNSGLHADDKTGHALGISADREALGKKLFLEFLEFRRALTQESDRGCALFAAAYLDVCLENLLRRCFVENKKAKEDLFESQGPLSTFSAKIKMAYYLGKIAPSERKDLDTIRSIRNDFAHHAENIDFDNQSIRDRCSNLVHVWQEKDARPRGKYTASVSCILAKIHIETLKAMSPEEQAERQVPVEVKKQVRERMTAAIAQASDEKRNTA